jgi:hypothetical protein
MLLTLTGCREKVEKGSRNLSSPKVHHLLWESFYPLQKSSYFLSISHILLYASKTFSAVERKRRKCQEICLHQKLITWGGDHFISYKNPSISFLVEKVSENVSEKGHASSEFRTFWRINHQNRLVNKACRAVPDGQTDGRTDNSLFWPGETFEQGPSTSSSGKRYNFIHVTRSHFFCGRNNLFICLRFRPYRLVLQKSLQCGRMD